jgi:hypothetical protein
MSTIDGLKIKAIRTIKVKEECFLISSINS